MATRSTGKGAASMVEVIVVPLDGSELAERAVPIATALATRVGSRLVLMSSLEPGAVEPEARLEKIAANIHGVEQDLAVDRRASRWDLAAVWLERGTRTINPK